MPYVLRYRGRAAAALVALLVASLATLVVPVAVRRMIDFGFSAEHTGLIDQYFGVMIAVVAVLATASAARYYLVTTLGERVVADLRSAVFSHLTLLSSPFFDTAKTGELTSRLTADTTQIKSAVGASVSIALRNLVLFLGSATMMVVTSPKLSFYVLVAIPVIVLPLVGFGRSVRRRSRAAQDTLAEASAYAAELIGAVRTLQAFTNERLAAARFAGAVERAYSAAIQSTKARAVLTAIIIFLVSASVVVVLWVGAQDVLAGDMTPGRLSQFVLFAVFAASGLGELSEVWGEMSQAAGSAERLAELLAVEPQIRAPAHPVALPARPRAEVAFDGVRFAYPTRPETECARRRVVSRQTGREGCDRRPLRRGQEHDLPSDPAVLRSDRGRGDVRRRSADRRRSRGTAPPHRAGAAGHRDLRHERARQHPVRPAGGHPTPKIERAAEAAAARRVHPRVAAGL